MKSLVFILVVGLTLSSSTRESIHNGRFTKLCGFDYLGEIHQICGSWPWKRFSPGLHGSSADDGVKRRRKDQWGYDHAGFQRFESDSDQGLFNNDDNQQVEGDYNERASGAEKDNMVHPAPSRRRAHRAISSLILHKLCCYKTCTRKDFLQVC